MNEVLVPPTGKAKPLQPLQPLGPSDARTPYSAAERPTLRSWAAHQPTAKRRSHPAALVSLGLGCGFGGLELSDLRASDVDDDGIGLPVGVEKKLLSRQRRCLHPDRKPGQSRSALSICQRSAGVQ